MNAIETVKSWIDAFPTVKRLIEYRSTLSDDQKRRLDHLIEIIRWADKLEERVNVDMQERKTAANMFFGQFLGFANDHEIKATDTRAILAKVETARKWLFEKGLVDNHDSAVNIARAVEYVARLRWF